MTYLQSIKHSDLRVGDIISIYGYGVLRDRLTVTRKTSCFIDADHTPGDPASFSIADSEWKFYLIERPKPKLPEYEGARIVAWKVEGKEYLDGIVLVHDGTVSAPWASDTTYYAPNNIEEWAEVPIGYFDDLKQA